MFCHLRTLLVAPDSSPGLWLRRSVECGAVHSDPYCASTSPAHAGFQRWTGEETWRETLDHVGRELYDPGAGSSLDRITKAAWGAFQKGELPKGDLFGGGFQGVFRVEGRLDSKKLDQELKGK